MSKRNIGQEIIQGLEEIKAWKRGELKLKTHTIEMPKAADVPAIRKDFEAAKPIPRKGTYKAGVRGTAAHARAKAA